MVWDGGSIGHSGSLCATPEVIAQCASSVRADGANGADLSVRPKAPHDPRIAHAMTSQHRLNDPN